MNVLWVAVQLLQLAQVDSSDESDMNKYLTSEVPRHYIETSQRNFVGRLGLQVTLPCMDDNFGPLEGDVIVVWKFG